MDRMRYPASTPTTYSGARVFVEKHGAQVWAELRALVPAGKWFRVREAAQRLPCLEGYSKPELYLRTVLKALIADHAERPEYYGHQPPITVRGRLMIEARIGGGNDAPPPPPGMDRLRKVLAQVALALPVEVGEDLAAALAEVAAGPVPQTWAGDLEAEVRRILRLRAAD
jgi:hypothetical protein